jgi:hypothetical protein
VVLQETTHKRTNAGGTMRQDMAFADDNLIMELGQGAKNDAKLLQHTNRPEAMILFRFWRKCALELNSRCRARHIVAMGQGYQLN